jgi:1-acyl-sn-glycerol-3-phosphate acyltransferase
LERYFVEPYRFIPPYPGTLWCRLLGRGLVARQLKRKLGVVRWHTTGLDLLRKSFDHKAGVLLSANHSRWADPMVMGMLSLAAQRYFYYIASYHLFRQSKVMGWVLNRLGGYSIWREGADRESLKATAAILAAAERPVVLFPEGTWFRQNDRVAPLQEGLSLITRQAARQSTRPIVVHPVAIKYWMLEDPTPRLRKRLEVLERRVGWSPQTDLPILVRIEKLGGALLALKEIEYQGQAQTGDLDDRIRRLADAEVERIEKKHLGKRHDGWLLERIRRLRQHLARRLHEQAIDEETARRVKEDLDDLLFFENLNAQSLDYVRADPSLERLAETILRIEETVTDEVEVPLAPMGAVIQVGPAIDARAFTGDGDRKDGDPLVRHLRGAMQGLLDGLLEKGPPGEWGCPPRTRCLADG